MHCLCTHSSNNGVKTKLSPVGNVKKKQISQLEFHKLAETLTRQFCLFSVHDIKMQIMNLYIRSLEKLYIINSK